MWWILIVLLQFLIVIRGIRSDQQAGLWSWSKFLFALGFGLLESTIVIVPITCIDPRSRYYVPIVTTAAVVAALNFIWMIIVARRWRLPDGRTSLQAWRDRQRQIQQGN